MSESFYRERFIPFVPMLSLGKAQCESTVHAVKHDNHDLINLAANHFFRVNLKLLR